MEGADNRVKVANNRVPVRSYVFHAKKKLKAGEKEVHISGLGLAISSVVQCVEMLKNQGLVEVKKIQTTTHQTEQRPVPKMEVTIAKSAKFDEIGNQFFCFFFEALFFS